MLKEILNNIRKNPEPEKHANEPNRIDDPIVLVEVPVLRPEKHAPNTTR